MTTTTTPTTVARAAPPQTPEAQAQQRALALPEVAQGVKLLDVAGREGVERFETVVTLPTQYQYAIPLKGIKNPDGSWDNSRAKVGLLSDGYDYLNRVIGATFFMPPTVHDQEGKAQPNPIHRRDYIYLRLAAVWYNPMGQMVMAVEDVEVDFQLIWMDARVNSKSATIVRDAASKQIMFDDFGNPALMLNDEDETKALKELTRLRSFGPRYALTVARTRLLKLATGIRSLPLNTPRDFPVRVVGFRDKMTPQERVAQVAADAANLYGAAPDIAPLSGAEMAEVRQDVMEDGEDIDRAHVASADGDRTPEVTPAPVGTVICGVAEADVKDSICLVQLDAEGKHGGPHKYTSGNVGPQT